MMRGTITCPRCDGTREEPGATADDRDGLALCNLCRGAGIVPAPWPTIATGRQAIATKYHGAGNVRGSRYSASCDGGRLYLGTDNRRGIEGNHAAAATALFDRLEWRDPDSVLVGGSLPTGGYAWVEVKLTELPIVAELLALLDEAYCDPDSDGFGSEWKEDTLNTLQAMGLHK